MFTTQLMMKCLQEILGTIVLNDSNYFIKKPDGMTFCYTVDEQSMFIDLPDQQSTAAYLLENGKIDHYKTEGDEVLLFRKSFYYSYDHKGRPVMVQNYISVKWEELTFSKDDVQLFAAREVWNKVSKGRSTYTNTRYTVPPSQRRYDA